MVKEVTKLICDLNGCEGELEHITETKVGTWRIERICRKTEYYRCTSQNAHVHEKQVIFNERGLDFIPYAGPLTIEELIEHAPHFKGDIPYSKQVEIASKRK